MSEANVKALEATVGVLQADCDAVHRYVFNKVASSRLGANPA